MEVPRSPKPEQRLVIENYDVEQILATFTSEELWRVDEYQRHHTDNPSLLFEAPLPPDFAPDKTAHHRMLTHNRLENRSQEVKDYFKTDEVADSIRRELPNHPTERAKTGRALRTRLVTIACMTRLGFEVKAAAPEEAELS